MEVTTKFRNPGAFNLSAVLRDSSIKKERKSLGRKIVVMDKQECIFLKIDDIVYAEANGAYTNVSLINGQKMMVCKNLKAFSERLPEEEFFRVHKSYIININCISRYVKSEGGYLVLDNGKQVPVSVRRRDMLTKLIEELSL